jgi:hypothetical protein
MHPNSFWLHLVWKDVRQLLPLILAFVCFGVLVLGISYWLEAGGSFTIDLRTHVAQFLPTLAIIAGISLLIGQERANGAWSWSSSLPIPWYASLAVKLVLISAMACGILTLVLSIEWMVATGTLIENVTFQRATGDVSLGGYKISEARWFWFHSLPLIAIAVLFGRNIVFSLIVGSLLCFLAVAWALPNTADVPRQWIVGWTCFGIEFVALAILYRWRWYQGQFFNLGFFLSRFWPASPVTTSFRYDQPRDVTPWTVLFWLSLRSQLGLRLIATSLPIFVFSMPIYEGFLYACGLSGALLGLSAFQGEQHQSQYRFLSERGVSPTIIYWSHLLPPLVLCLAVGFTMEAIRAYGYSMQHFPMDTMLYLKSYSLSQISMGPVLLSLAGFAVAQLVMICVPSTTIAVATSLLIILSAGIYMHWFRILVTQHSFHPRSLDWQLRGLLFAIAFCVGVGQLYVSRQWILQYRPRFGRVLVASLCLSFLGSWLVSGLGVLEIPAVPWQGRSVLATGQAVDDPLSAVLIPARLSSNLLSRDDLNEVASIYDLASQLHRTWTDDEILCRDSPSIAQQKLMREREIVDRLSKLPVGSDDCWAYSDIGTARRMDHRGKIHQLKWSCVRIAILAACLGDTETTDKAIRFAQPTSAHRNNLAQEYWNKYGDPSVSHLFYRSDDLLRKMGIDRLRTVLREPHDPSEYLKMQATAMLLDAEGRLDFMDQDTRALWGLDRNSSVSPKSAMDGFMTFWARKAHIRMIASSLKTSLDLMSDQLTSEQFADLDSVYLTKVNATNRPQTFDARTYPLIIIANDYQVTRHLYLRLMERLERLREQESGK